MADQAFMDAIKAFEESPVAVAEVSGDDLCAIYKKVKPILTGILPFIKLIPVFGATAVTAITALMAVIDIPCPGV